MLHIQSLKFFGFKDPKKIVSVAFSPSPVSVIYGDNGSGKTSFLRAISAFLAQDESTLHGLGVKKIECAYLHDSKLKTITVERKEISYDWTNLVDSPLRDAKSISLGIERGISTQPPRIEPELIYEFFRRSPRGRFIYNKNTGVSARELAEELSFFLKRRQASVMDRLDEIDEAKAHQNLQNVKLENIERLLLDYYRHAIYSANLKIQDALFNTLADVINNDKMEGPSAPLDIYTSVVEYRSRLIEALSNDNTVEKNQFKATIVDLITSLNEHNYTEVIKNKPLLGVLFSNMILELEREKLALGAVNLLVDTFNKYLIEDKKLVVSSSEIYVKIGNNQHSIHDLSSGERHILTFLSLVLFQGRHRDFLIIDEPEISLNIEWQRKLLDLFMALVPKTQIIVASHSPVLAKRHPEFLTPLLTDWEERS